MSIKSRLLSSLQALNFLDEVIDSDKAPSRSRTPMEDVRREFSHDEEGRPIVIEHHAGEDRFEEHQQVMFRSNFCRHDNYIVL